MQFTLEPGLEAERLPLESIPVVDFTPFLQGDDTDRQRVADQIAAACQHIGFFYLINHGIDATVMETVFAMAQRFFQQPLEVKRQIAIEQSSCHRGYFAIGGENLDPAKQRQRGDLKEGIKIGQDLPLSHPLVQADTPLHGPNQWPELSGFQPVMTDYFQRCEQLGHRLLQALALALHQPEDFFEDKLTLPMATLGPLHYPPQSGEIRESQLGAGAHTDYGCITLLAQDHHGGLQVRNAAGQWVAAPPIPAAFVVNIGDMMARWTNNLFTSTPHRVINTSGADRYSLPFFFDPDFHAEVACLDSCCNAERPVQYPPTSAGQYLLERINASFEYHRQLSTGMSS